MDQTDHLLRLVVELSSQIRTTVRDLGDLDLALELVETQKVLIRGVGQILTNRRLGLTDKNIRSSIIVGVD